MEWRALALVARVDVKLQSGEEVDRRSAVTLCRHVQHVQLVGIECMHISTCPDELVRGDQV